MMAGKRGIRGKGSSKSSTNQSLVPDVYQEMLMEVLPLQTEPSVRPIKQQKIGRSTSKSLSLKDIQKQDGFLPDESLSQSKEYSPEAQKSQLSSNLLPNQQQTVYEDFDEDSESDYDWENVELDMSSNSKITSKDLELTLSNSLKPQSKRVVPGRKAVSKADRFIRLGIHKVNILCLLSHLHRRNDWCNDACVQNSLEPLLSEKLQRFLLPNSSLSQFGRTESLKRGLDEISILWKTRFNITERGMRRALWSDDTTKLKDFNLPEDMDSVNDLKSFRAAATELKGSRDVGAQLFCALLRSADVDTRLVFSLQLLPFKVGGPLRTSKSSIKSSTNSENQGQGCLSTADTDLICPSTGNNEPIVPGPYSPVARRLGHPNAADYILPKMSNSQKPIPKPKQKEIKESSYPVYWVEVFDEAHQKWLPVDPLVTQTIARPRRLEPPSSDQDNSMTYVIAIEKDGSARDVTRRYVKAYNGKTRKGRVESTPGGDKWWTKTMKLFSPGCYSDADQIELLELANAESMEPMPKNVVDFKDHSYYALERHLRRNEVLVSTRECGKVAVGRDSKAAGGKKMENVYRRQDVKTVRSADAWYRMGREIKMGEQPVKVVQSKKRIDDSFDTPDRSSINLYTEEQTHVYRAPPIINGRVPKNSYGNIDIFVPTMVPDGGIHLCCRYASQAAKIINIDYADALTGFEFRGRHGTAIFTGIVVASEYSEAVQAVAEGLEDEDAQIEQVARAFAAFKMWKRLLIALRIRKRIAGYRIEGEDSELQECYKTKNPRVDDDATCGDEMQGGFIPEL